MKKSIPFGLVLVCITWCIAAEAVQIGCNRLQLILPDGLDPATVENAWGKGEAEPKMSAILELLGCNGQLLDRLVLDGGLARLDPDPVSGAPLPTYLVSVDLTADAGSYNGPLTIPVELVKHRLRRVTALTPNGHRESINLPLTAKAAWKKVPAKGVDDLLAVNCQKDKGGFAIYFRRYHPTKSGWVLRTRSEPGFWESDSGFPETRKFP